MLRHSDMHRPTTLVASVVASKEVTLKLLSCEAFQHAEQQMASEGLDCQETPNQLFWWCRLVKHVSTRGTFWWVGCSL